MLVKQHFNPLKIFFVLSVNVLYVSVVSLHLGDISRNFQYKFKYELVSVKIEQIQQYLLRGIMIILNIVTRLLLEYLILFPFLSLTIEMHFQIGICLLCIHSTSYLYLQVGYLLMRRTFSEVFIPFRVNSSM